MSLDYDLSKVDRDAWPGALPLFDFCQMMMVTGVPSLTKDEDLVRLRNRALVMDALKGFGWKHHDKKDGQLDMIDLIPLMRGLRTNCSTYSRTEFFKRLKDMGVTEL